MCPSCMFCTRNNLKILSSDVLRTLARTRAKHQQQPACITWLCSYLLKHNMEGHSVDVERVKLKLKNKGHILTAARYYRICSHAVQTRSTLHHLITRCCVKAQLLVTTPGSQRHPQIFHNISEDLNRGVTFSLLLSLLVFLWLFGSSRAEEFVVSSQMMMCWFEPMKNKGSSGAWGGSTHSDTCRLTCQSDCLRWREWE